MITEANSIDMRSLSCEMYRLFGLYPSKTSLPKQYDYESKTWQVTIKITNLYECIKEKYSIKIVVNSYEVGIPVNAVLTITDKARNTGEWIDPLTYLEKLA